jgi:hypothetical protein
VIAGLDLLRKGHTHEDGAPPRRNETRLGRLLRDPGWAGNQAGPESSRIRPPPMLALHTPVRVARQPNPLGEFTRRVLRAPRRAACCCCSACCVLLGVLRAAAARRAACSSACCVLLLLGVLRAPRFSAVGIDYLRDAMLRPPNTR